MLIKNNILFIKMEEYKGISNLQFHFVHTEFNEVNAVESSNSGALYYSRKSIWRSCNCIMIKSYIPLDPLNLRKYNEWKM